MEKEHITNIKRKKSFFATKDIALIAVMTLFIVGCSYIAIPFSIPFTMQTFAIFTSLLILGGKRGAFSIVAYLLLGMLGLPVFTGFNGGLGAFVGPTGGYLIGFVVVAIVYAIFEMLFKNNNIANIAVLAFSTIVLHILGGVWIWAFGYQEMQFDKIVLTFMLPSFMFDFVKLIFAVIFSKILHTKARVD